MGSIGFCVRTRRRRLTLALILVALLLPTALTAPVSAEDEVKVSVAVDTPAGQQGTVVYVDDHPYAGVDRVPVVIASGVAPVRIGLLLPAVQGIRD
jgi:hypothetical protein